jgi:predicted RNA binding protein YcfA (HicA-like mRNA interferase family)
MKKLPVITGYDAIKALRKAGFIATRQRGSHVRLKKIEDGKTIKITVPVHGTLKKGTLNRIIKDVGLTRDEFLRLL